LPRICWHSWVLATANPLLQKLYEASTVAGVSYKCKHDPIRYLLHKNTEVLICSQDTKNIVMKTLIIIPILFNSSLDIAPALKSNCENWQWTTHTLPEIEIQL
jgi:hypothetical protein